MGSWKGMNGDRLQMGAEVEKSLSNKGSWKRTEKRGYQTTIIREQKDELSFSHKLGG